MKKPKDLSIFSFKSYRKFLNEWIIAQEQPRGLMKKLAEAARCETSHMSRALSGQLELTPDQSFRLAKFLRLTEAEQKYFLKLVDYERSGDAEFKKIMEAELNSMIEAQQNLAQRFQTSEMIMEGKEMLYYSSWHWSAIHIIVSIPEFQNVEAIAQRLGLAENFVQQSLIALQTLGLVKQEGSKWKNTTEHIHLSKSSPMNSVQNSNWRQRAVLKTQDPHESGLHYTVVQTLSREDFEKIRELFFKSLDQYRAIANPSKEEELICLNIDFFKV